MLSKVLLLFGDDDNEIGFMSTYSGVNTTMLMKKGIRSYFFIRVEVMSAHARPNNSSTLPLALSVHRKEHIQRTVDILLFWMSPRLSMKELWQMIKLKVASLHKHTEVKKILNLLRL